MRALKIVGWVVGGLLLLMVGLVAAVAIGGDRALAYLIEHQGSALLHRDIRLGGGFHVAWGNPIRIVADDVHVANAPWGTEPDMFAARHLELEIEPWPLLRGKFSIPRVALDGSRTLLETSDKGEKNWDLFAAKAAAPEKRTEFPDIRRVEVTDSSFAFRNGETKANTDVGLAKVLAETPDATSPIKLAGDGTLQKQPFHLEGTVGAVAQLQNPAEPYGVDLRGTLGEAKLAVSGKMTEPLELAGLHATVSADGKDLQDTLAVVGLPIPTTPPYHVSGEIKHDGTVWKVEQLETRLGKSQIAGGISVDTGQRVPYIQANLAAKYLDIADFQGFIGGTPPGSEKETPKKPEGSRLIPDMKLPLEKLPGFNADVSFDGADVRPAAGLPLQRVSLGLALKDGVLRVKPLRFAMATGEVSTDATLSSAVQPPSLDLNVDVRRIDLHKLVAGMSVPKQVKETGGILGASVKVKGKGTSTRELVGSLDGEFALFMENGQISHILVALLNLDVANAVNFLVQGDKPHPIDCVLTHFDVKNGIATADTFLIDTTETVVDGKGNINFRDETLFLDLTPHAKDWSPLRLREPIHIRGTFRNPSATPDKVGLAARLGAAIGLGVLFPPAALLPLIETGLGSQNTCGRAFAAQQETQTGNDAAKAAGSSQAPPSPRPRSAQPDSPRGGSTR
jgi:hypothetical protein